MLFFVQNPKDKTFTLKEVENKELEYFPFLVMIDYRYSWKYIQKFTTKSTKYGSSTELVNMSANVVQKW